LTRVLVKGQVTMMEKTAFDEWCVLRVVGETVQTVGYVWATEEEAAISEAIKRFGPVGRGQSLVAHRVPQPSRKLK